MTGRYAEGTTVASDRSRAELEKLLRRFMADQFAYGWDVAIGKEMIAFRMNNRQIKMTLPLPDPADSEFRLTPAGRRRTEQAQQESYEQEVRRRWRSLVAVTKAKLIAVQDGISTVEREFLADTVVPGTNETVGERIATELEQAYLKVGYRPRLEISQ